MGIQLNVTEWMRGHVGFGAADYQSGEATGREKKATFEHEVLIQMKDIDRFVSEPKHSAPMDGKVDWLGESCPFSGGEFNMLVDSTQPSIKYMFYRIPFADGSGKKLTMLGHKTLRDDPGLDLWGDITTLFIRIYEGHVAGHDFTRPSGDAPEWPDGHVALGIIHIPLRDGFNSALSFDAPGSSKSQKAEAVGKFLSFYGSRVVELWVKESAPQRGFGLALVAVAGLAVAGAVVVALFE
jgi:cholesterol oxidase